MRKSNRRVQITSEGAFNYFPSELHTSANFVDANTFGVLKLSDLEFRPKGSVLAENMGVEEEKEDKEPVHV